MSHVAIQRIHPAEAQSHPVLEQIKSLADRIRDRAYQLFENRGHKDGSDVDDWLRAESDLLTIPKSDLVETEGKFEMQVAVPGFDSNEIEIDVLPDSLIVRAENSHKHETTKDHIQFCEFSEKELFRRFDLPTAINVDRVTANLDKGLLHITAPKAEEAKPATAA